MPLSNIYLWEKDVNRQVQRELESRKKLDTDQRQEALNKLLVPKQLPPLPDGLLHYGCEVLLHLPEVHVNRAGRASQSKSNMTVVVCPTPPALLHPELGYASANVTASKQHHSPCARNTFTLLARRGTSAHLDTAVHYGDQVLLQFTSPAGEQLYLESPGSSLVYTGRTSRRSEVMLSPSVTAASAWSIQPLRQRDREETRGKPVSSGKRVWLVQVMSNLPLVVEEGFVVQTMFGQESEVSVGGVGIAHQTYHATATVCLLTVPPGGAPTDGAPPDEAPPEPPAADTNGVA